MVITSPSFRLWRSTRLDFTVMPLVLFRSSTMQALGLVRIWQWWRLTKRLSICRSLSGVRPMMVRPVRSGNSPTVRPSDTTISLASGTSGTDSWVLVSFGPT